MPEARLMLRHAGQRVLVVDDNPICQDVLVELLRAVGLQVDVADNGAQALDLAAVHPYALVLMDVQMPVLAGHCAARTLRERNADGPPVIAMTADANPADTDRDGFLDEGMCDRLLKPVSQQSLYACLLRWLPPTGPLEIDAAEPAADPHLDAMLSRLTRVDGFDVSKVLGNLGGSLPFLERTLGKFVKAYRGGVPELSGPSRPGDLQAWRSACHALRGATATVGATTLQREIARFEAAMNASLSEPELQALARRLDQCVVELADQLDQAVCAPS